MLTKEQALYGCRLLGMHGIINEQGVNEFWFRAIAWTISGRDDFLNLTYQDVEAHIGLKRTDVTRGSPRPKFFAEIGRRLAFDATAVISRHPNSGCKITNRPIHSIIP